MNSNLSPEEIDRLWQHGMHEDKIFNDRLHFFLIVESILLGLMTVLLSNPTSKIFILNIFAILGLFLTIVWLYVQSRQLYVFNELRKRLRENLPEYKMTTEEREKKKWKFSNLKILTYVIPIIFIIMWLLIVFYSFLRSTVE